MTEDFELQLRRLQPAAPSGALKSRLRRQFDPEPKAFSFAAWLRLAIPAAACVLVIAALTVNRRGVSSEAAACIYGQIPAQASTSVYFPYGEAPLQITRSTSQAYVAWHDAKSGQEIFRTFPCEHIVIAPLSIQ
jgi:hypothetical protein